MPGFYQLCNCHEANPGRTSRGVGGLEVGIDVTQQTGVGHRAIRTIGHATGRQIGLPGHAARALNEAALVLGIIGGPGLRVRAGEILAVLHTHPGSIPSQIGRMRAVPRHVRM